MMISRRRKNAPREKNKHGEKYSSSRASLTYVRSFDFRIYKYFIRESALDARTYCRNEVGAGKEHKANRRIFSHVKETRQIAARAG